MATRRYLDLLQQGFMRPTKPRHVRRLKLPRKIVACVRCQDWHPAGAHRRQKPADE